LPEAALRVCLTCPRCRKQYKLVHSLCGIAIGVREALCLRECSVCKENGQDSRVSEADADCPDCGLECRKLAQVEDECESSGNPRYPRTVKPVKGICFVCGNPALEMHHLNWDHSNNSPENLRLVCEWYHLQAHKLGKPLFEELVDRVGKNSEQMVTLRQSSKKWYRRIHGE
jgi:hypothetical protein